MKAEGTASSVRRKSRSSGLPYTRLRLIRELDDVHASDREVAHPTFQGSSLIRVLACFTVAAVLVGTAWSQPGKPGGVAIVGDRFIDHSGTPLRLCGVNINDWGVTTEEDVRRIHDSGMNFARLCWNEDAPKTRLLEFADQFEKNRIYWMLCLFRVGPWSQSPTQAHIWEPGPRRDGALRFWQEKTELLRGRPYLLGFELINEPVPKPEEVRACCSLLRELTSGIQALDSDRIVVIPGLDWSSVYGMRREIVQGRGNIAYTWHFYLPQEFTHEKAGAYPGWVRPKSGTPYYANANWMDQVFSRVASFRTIARAPVILGEFGCAARDDNTPVINWNKDVISLAEKYRFGWCYWDYKDRWRYDFSLYYNQYDGGTHNEYRSWNEMIRLLSDSAKQPR